MHFSVSYKLLTMGKGAKIFQQKWCSLYGLKITARDASSGRINTVECRFCRFFGKDDTRSDPKRCRTESMKVFSKPWRSDHMKAHVQEQHSIKYDEYAELSDEQMTFFDGSFATDGARRAASVFGRSHEDTALTFYTDKPIVVNVLGDLLFDPDDDEDAATRTCPVSARIKHTSELFLAPRNNSRGSLPESPEKNPFWVYRGFPENNLAYLRGRSVTVAPPQVVTENNSSAGNNYNKRPKIKYNPSPSGTRILATADQKFEPRPLRNNTKTATS
jgi:hypothetical protein